MVDAVAARGIGIPRYGNLSNNKLEMAYRQMTGPLDHMRMRLDRCRKGAVHAAQEAVRVEDAWARQSYALLAEGWRGLGDDLERRLSDAMEDNES